VQMRFPARGDDTHTQAGDPVYLGGEAGSPEIMPVRGLCGAAPAADMRSRASELLAQHRMHGAGGVVLTARRAVALLRKCRGHLEQRHVMLRPQRPGGGDQRGVALRIGLAPLALASPAPHSSTGAIELGDSRCLVELGGDGQVKTFNSLRIAWYAQSFRADIGQLRETFTRYTATGRARREYTIQMHPLEISPLCKVFERADPCQCRGLISLFFFFLGKTVMLICF
jgi:hypothetical protein